MEGTFITATTLPLLIALAKISQRDRIMPPPSAAAVVGAGVLSALVNPPYCGEPARSAPLTPADAGIPAAEIHYGGPARRRKIRPAGTVKMARAQAP